MATLGTRYITLRDIQSGRTPNGFVDKDIVELMAQENPILDDVLWKQCTRGREDVVTIRTGMPEAVVTSYYEGWAGSKTSKKQVTNACCRVKTGIEFDWDLYEDQKDKAAFIADEQRAHASVLGDKVAALLLYGDSEDDPRGINGFAKTFSEAGSITGADMAMDERKAAFYCISAGKTAELDATSGVSRRSVFLVGWGARSAHGIYPENSSMGIKVDSLISQFDKLDTGNNLKVGKQEMSWQAGLNIRDFRYCGRIANINVMSDPEASGTPDVVKCLRRLVTRVKTAGVTQRLYMSKLAFEHIAAQFEKKTSSNAVKYADLEQKKDAALLGIPVAFCDCMNTEEAAVPAAV